MPINNLDVAQRMFPISKEKFRYVGIPYRIKINSWEEIKMYIKMYNGFKPLYISLASYINKIPYLNYIFFDFDGKTAQNDVEEIINYFDYYNWIPYHIIESSKYGRHVYLKVPDFPYTKAVYLNVYETMLSKLSLPSFDNHIKGNIAQMVRIPGTINIKDNSPCEFSKDNKFNLDDKPTMHPNLLKTQKNSEYISDNSGKMDMYPPAHTFPCLENQMKLEEPPHIARFYYVTILISFGWSNKEIFEKLKSFNWVDFSPNITAYQINHIRQGGYRPPTCQTIEEKGYCLSDCPRWKD